VNILRAGPNLVGKTLAWLSRRSYRLGHAYFHYNLRQESQRYNQPPVLIYQMGKVGSKTVRDSLQALKLDRRVFHVHFLAPERVREMERERRKYLGTPKAHLLKHVWQYEYLNRQLAGGFNGKQWKVVTLTREPIGRNLSTFFENLEIEPMDEGRCYNIQSDYYGFQLEVNEEDLSELQRQFFKNIRHDSPLVFFDNELKRMLGVDVYASGFPTTQGYKIYEAPHVDVLLVRLENLNACAQEAFREFLGIEQLRLINTNIGSKKPHGSLYQKFVETITLPAAYVDQMYTSKYVRHFYTADEIGKFRAKWLISSGAHA